MLTGITRYRLGWRKKMVLQVSEWAQEFTYKPWEVRDWVMRWRDAAFQDVIDLERGKVQREKPPASATGRLRGPYGGQPYTPDALPPTRREPPPMPSVAPPNMAQMPVHEAGSISYEFINLTGLEE